METAYAHGLMSGYPDGTFRSGAEANRGQVSKVTMHAAFPPEE
ncbi:MAG: S-layer homology domain-containing protein [Chloroflexia bacterium]